MGVELRCEGFCLDEELEERLLIACRRIVLASGWDRRFAATIRLVEGRMQARLELFVPGRRIFSIVWRDDPVEAMEGAVEALAAVVADPRDGAEDERPAA
jgi:hypothetical protein